MSPRAACRLERLGYTTYDYAAGKVDWLAAGMPSVRSDTSERGALDDADRHPPTCAPGETVGTVDTSVLVVNEQQVVLGRVPAGRHPASALAVDVMESGPTTVRAHEPLDALLTRMDKRQVHEIVVTTPEGRLLSVVRQT